MATTVDRKTTRTGRKKTPYVDADRARRAKRALTGNRALERLTKTFRALGDPTRSKVILALSVEELCVRDLAQLLRVSHSVVSHQLRVLRGLGLVHHRKEGRTVYYSLDSELIRVLFTQTLTGARRVSARRDLWSS